MITSTGITDEVQEILVQDDQKILAVGWGYYPGLNTESGSVFRYLQDGTLDLSFATDGRFVYAFDYETRFSSAVITPEGKILVAGSTGDGEVRKLILVQLTMDGALDNSFGNGGIVLQTIYSTLENAASLSYGLALDATGSILVCGGAYDENFLLSPFVARFLTSGVIDPNFGVDGIATIPSGFGYSSLTGILIQPDGRIVCSGFFDNTVSTYVMLLARFTADGTLDPGFGVGGTVNYDHGGIGDFGADLKLTPDGSFLVVGTTSVQVGGSANNMLLVKFTSSGSLDTSFGTAGYVEEDMSTFDVSSNVDLLEDGTIIVTGTSGVAGAGVSDLVVYKYLNNGARDLTFGSNGFVQPEFPESSSRGQAACIQPDGKILVGGKAWDANLNGHFLVCRLQNDFSIGINEPSVSTVGAVFPNPAVANSTVTMRIPQTIQQDAWVGLHSADGRLVFTTRNNGLQRDAQNASFQLPAELAPGVYKLVLGQQSSIHSASILIRR
ncbi:MAG: hypothetical protein LKM36_03065 [Flavobacteriales bacterium]|nr:hypothetical protein [Flavobacteriales bacterium]